MEYVKFDSDNLNSEFVLKTKKREFTMQDLLSLDISTRICIVDNPIAQHDIDILSQLKIPDISFSNVDLSNLNFEKCNFDKIKFENCILEGIKISKSSSQEILLSINDCCGMSQEKLEDLQQNFGTNIHFNIKGDSKESYTLNEFSSVISIMEEIKSSIPENSSELEKFLFVYNVLGQNIEYDNSGCVGNEFYTEEAEKSTRSLLGTLVKGKGVCVGYALALSQVLKYIGIESEKVGSTVHLSDGTASGHAWVKVKIDDNFYYSDLTWDYRHLDELPYCLKSPLDETFREEHDELTDDLNSLKYELKSEKSNQPLLNLMFDDLFSDFDSPQNEEKTSNYDHEPTDYELCIKSGYATESYNQEIMKETMKKVRNWTELEQSLKTIEELKNAPEAKKTIDISDINDVIYTVRLDDYIKVQQDVIKEEEKTNTKDYSR